MTAIDWVRPAVAANSEDLLGLSHRIAANPELGFEEHQASSALAAMLEKSDFEVTVGVAGLDTAVHARYGSGELRVAFLAEYDALPGIGHACGHNVIAAASLGAATALAPLADDLGLTVVVIGTPAEENGGGKILLLEAGVFDEVDAALMVHPGPKDFVEMPTLATTELTVRYQGKAAHASAFPERGVNAADAATVAQVGIGLLRQHLGPDERVHGIITEAGEAPNVIPRTAVMRYLVRAGSIDGVAALEARVRGCFSAGAQATGCDVEVTRTMPVYAELRSDADLAERYRANAAALGRDAADPSPRARRAAGSTDMGNVSQTIPAIHPMIGIDSLPDVPHQPGFAAAAAGATGDQAVLDGAAALAATAVDAASIETLRKRLLGGET